MKERNEVVSMQQKSRKCEKSALYYYWTHLGLIDLHTLPDDSDVITRARAQRVRPFVSRVSHSQFIVLWPESNGLNESWKDTVSFSKQTIDRRFE
jgi:hypothetical protein